MDFMLYPAFEFIEMRGQFLPIIRLPRDFEERIPKFYEQRIKEEIEDYAKIIGKEYLNGTEDIEDYSKIIGKEYLKNDLEIRLLWDDERGLINISVSPSQGLDLSKEGWPNFQEHNLGTKTGIAAGFIAMKYISELLKIPIEPS
mgnify:CR=1 FL=1